MGQRGIRGYKSFFHPHESRDEFRECFAVEGGEGYPFDGAIETSHVTVWSEESEVAIG